MVSAGQGGKIRVWSCPERRLLRELDASDVRIWQLVFQADGKRMLSIDAKGQAIWWETVAWQAVRTFALDPATLQLSIAAASPDGRLLAVRAGATVRWFNAETGEPLATSSEGHRQVVLGIAFSCAGAWAASAADDGTVAIWDPASLQLITTFKGHMHTAWGVAFSPDGRRFATGSGHRDAVKLWDLSTHREVMNLPGQSFHFRFVAFSPDGRWLAACGSSNELHLWHAPSWEEIEAAENRGPVVRDP